MTYSKKINRKVNWENARFKAYEVFRKHKVRSFPLNIISIIKQYPDIKIISYSEMAKKRGISMDEVILANSSPDGSIHYSPKKDSYIITYNDLKIPERVYWTIAHEFGHYYLEHHKETDRSTLSRITLTEDEYDLFEQEADFFARFLINPPSLIKEWENITYQRVMGFFKVSYTAANNSLDYLRRIARNGWTVSVPMDIKEQMSTFTFRVNKGMSCTKCNSFFVFEETNFCPICGGKNLNHFFIGDDIDMKYPGISHTNGKMDVCPICENEEILDRANHCNQCGIYILNHCSDTSSSYGRVDTFNCETALPYNSRYCHVCGQNSTFLNNKLLEEWRTERENFNKKENDTFQNNPSNEVFIDSNGRQF